MQTTFSHRAVAARSTGLIVAALVVTAALAAAAALLVSPQRPSWAAAPGSQEAPPAVVSVGIAGESTVAGDPSLPSAASVFRDRAGASEATVDTF